jgi:hypothetical protein
METKAGTYKPWSEFDESSSTCSEEEFGEDEDVDEDNLTPADLEGSDFDYVNGRFPWEDSDDFEDGGLPVPGDSDVDDTRRAFS